MKSVGLLALLALSACSAVPHAGVQNRGIERDHPTRASLLLGQRNLDEDDYAPVEEQFMIGFEFAHEARDSVLGWEFGFAGSSDSEDVEFFGEELEVTASTAELYGGIRKSFPVGIFRPYIGGGVAYIFSELELEDDFGNSASVDDGSVAGYVHIGAMFDITRWFFLGIDLRLLFGSDLDYDGFESDADYGQLALRIGAAF